MPRTRKVVLAWADTRNGIAQHDSVSHALAVIERLGYESGAYDTYIRTDSNIMAKSPLMTTGQPASGGPSLANVDAIFFLGHREVPLDDKQKADLLSFVKDDGKGFVAAHTATTAFLDWPEFGEMIGARYDGHPWGSAAGTVINEDPDVPGHEALRRAPFPFTDEFYQAKDYSRDKLRVLLRLDVSKMPPNQEVHRTDGDFPLAWAKNYGKGRVFYSVARARGVDLGQSRRPADVLRGDQVVARHDRRGRHAAAAAGGDEIAMLAALLLCFVAQAPIAPVPAHAPTRNSRLRHRRRPHCHSRCAT